MTGVFILDGARTAIGRHGGALAHVRPDDLAATVIEGAVRKAGVDPALVDHVVFGAANQSGEDSRNVARMASLLAGLPVSIPAFTVNRLCGSGMTAITTAKQMIMSGDADVVVAGGVESMTRAPWALEKPPKPFAPPGQIHDTALGWRFTNPRFGADTTLSMAETAELVAHRWGISREDADAFALRSHERAVGAIGAGLFDSEIVGVHAPGGEVCVDEGPRPDTSAERLARLKPVTRAGGVVTAGNASSLNDGAAAVVVASGEFIDRHGLHPRARVVSSAETGVPPEIMGIGPVEATRAALARARWSLDDLGAVELNEAFAAQALACMADLGLDHQIVNADGGAIALGHPLGCSGVRIVVTLMGRMERSGAPRGLAAMCVGVGQGTAILLETP